MSKICEKCGVKFNNHVKINGITKNLCNRKYCLNCSPWGKHNTKKLTGKEEQGYIICSKCKDKKPESEFNKRDKLHFHSHCKVCLYREQSDRWTNRKKDAVLSFGGKCTICGYDKNFSALHFHHKEPSIKEFSWTKLKLRSNEAIKKELDKCELICSNCHAELHNPNCCM